MLHRRENDTIIIKMESGEDVLESLGRIAEFYRIESGTIQWGIGMLHDIEVGYFNGKEYEKQKYVESAEIVSFHGSIASNDPRFHVHLSFAGRDHAVHGGHLFAATVDPLLEVEIHVVSTINISRVINKNSGLKEISIQ
jgi:predicted DNA-binding protein with PD1-like motif